MFKSLELHDWRQFEKVSLDFHPIMTILTGSNGSGKTTILSLLSRHLGWGGTFISTPKKDKKSGFLTYFADAWNYFFDAPPQKPKEQIGHITYVNGSQHNLFVPFKVGSTYDIEIESVTQMPGLHLPSHRSIFSYQKIDSISTTPITSKQAFTNYSTLAKNNYTTGQGGCQNVNIKQALLSWALLGLSNESVIGDPSVGQYFIGFQDVLRKVLPPKIGFKSLLARSPEIVLDTESGDFSLDAVSGGIAAIIDLVWQVYLFSLNSQQFIVTLDEPENHLHPEMQRQLLPKLILAFPKTQFIIATHNPIIISSVEDSNVFVLNYNDKMHVVSTKLDLTNKAGTANEILRDVLGLNLTTPIWAEQKLDEIISKYSQIQLSKETVMNLKNDLEKVGLSKYIPDTIANTFSKQN